MKVSSSFVTRAELITNCSIVVCQRFEKAFYSLVINLRQQSIADKFFNVSAISFNQNYQAFNGRFFNEMQASGEMMHAVFLSEPIIVTQKNEQPVDISLLS